MAHYTSVQDGNWSKPATWGTTTVPGNGDTVTVAHHVYVDQNTIIGESIEVGNAAISISDGGWLEVDGYVTLTARGDIVPTVPAIDEDDEMLDVGDIGIIYNDSSTATAQANTAALQAFLNERAGSGGIELRFSGNRDTSYNNKRIGQPVYFDLSSGPITNTSNPSHDDELHFVGAPGCVITGKNALSATTPVFKIYRIAGKSTNITLRDLHINNPLGSGIWFTSDDADSGPGQGTRLIRCKVRYCGTSLGTQSFDEDGWSDVDPTPTVPYGVRYEEADGMMIRDCLIRTINGHGIIAKRQNRGHVHASVRDCYGTGVKAERVVGTYWDIVAESNKLWGVHVRDCGNYRYTAGGLEGISGGAQEWHLWLEGNNARDAVVYPFQSTPGSGYTWRQARFESSSGIKVIGHNGWEVGKFDLEESVRRSNEFVDRKWIDPSAGDGTAFLEYDMNTDGLPSLGGSYDNFSTAWSNPSYRPTLATTGSTGSGTLEGQFTIPAECYDQASVIGYYFFQTALQGNPGDMLLWSVDISCDDNGAQHCIDRENNAGGGTDGTLRSPAYLGSFTIWGPNAGSAQFALWNTSRRKFCGRCYLEDSRTFKLMLYLFISPMDDVASTGINWPENPIQINLHSVRMYRIGAEAAVPSASPSPSGSPSPSSSAS